MKLKRIFLLSWKKILLILISWVVTVFLHNLVYGLFQDFFVSHGTNEPFFFIIFMFVIPLYLLICLVYTAVYCIKIKIKPHKKS